jgi:membrane-bound serine protease (ClpP class)
LRLGVLSSLLGVLLASNARPAAANEMYGAFGFAAAGASLPDRLAQFVTVRLVGAFLFGLGALLVVWSLVADDGGILTGLGLGALVLFFWGHIAVGLSGWEGVALAALGFALVAVEVLALPGFGIAGVLGGVALLGSLVLSVTAGTLPSGEAVERAFPAILLAKLIFVIGGVVLLRLLPATALRRGLVLQAGNAALAADPAPSLEGARGEALADLRPGGFARIGGERIDVITRGEVIAGGATIEVLRDEGYRRIVRQIMPDEPDEEVL